MSTPTSRLTKTLLLLALLGFLLSTGAASADEVWPGSSWQSATPGEANMRESDLTAARDFAPRGLE